MLRPVSLAQQWIAIERALPEDWADDHATLLATPGWYRLTITPPLVLAAQKADAS